MGKEYDHRKANYDQILFRVKKGKREEYQQAAGNLGIGFWALIQHGVEEYIANHGGEIIQKPEAEKLTAEERRLLTAFAKLPKNAQINLIKTLEALSPQKEG
ncbi:MAG: hypothetical protein SR1Q5_06275 [Quinella sp. 1Q5]|nr:hypothetical protein [Quinella sp. 1Q5]